MSKAGTGFRAWVTAFTVVFTLLSPASALAGSGTPPPGVHVDPGSPATKEYAIPLGTARGNGNATTGGPEPLFGSGITKASPAPTTTAVSTEANPSPVTSDTSSSATPRTPVRRPRRPRPVHRRSSHRRTRGALAASGSVRTPTPPSPQSVIGTHGSSGTGITWMIAAAAAVLLLGGAGGAALSRRARGTGPDPFTR